MTTKKLSELPLAGTYNGSEYLLGMQNGMSTKFPLGTMGGTWVPATTGITYTGTPTYSGYYTKIGNVVNAHFWISSTSITIPALATITLPFTSTIFAVGSSANAGATMFSGIVTGPSTITATIITAISGISNYVGSITYTTS